MAELLIGARYNSFKEFETVFQQYQRENGILFVKTASKKGIVPRTLLATRLGIAASKKWAMLRNFVNIIVNKSNWLNKVKQMAEKVAIADSGALKRPASPEIETKSKKSKNKGKPHVVQLGKAEGFKRKVAMMVAYNGAGYYGVQVNPGFPTIESEIFPALVKVGSIPQDHADTTSKMWFQRGSRTDKGVSAAGQIFSLKIVLVPDLVAKMNEILPAQIRVIGYIRTTNGFDSKNFCCNRTYMYMMPTFAFAPIEKFVTDDYRTMPEILNNVRKVLQRYKGTHNFHNFTSGVKFQQACASRYIINFECSEPYVREGLEFVTIRVKGQSFMLHQIRKMIGLTIAIVRGYCGESVIDATWKSEKVDIPIAPGLGLVLEQLHFDGYNKKWGCDGVHDPIDWSAYKEEVDDFKEKFIISHIVAKEKSERVMMNWLQTLQFHNFDETRTEGPRKPWVKTEKLLKDNENKQVEDSEPQVPIMQKEGEVVNDSEEDNCEKLNVPKSETPQEKEIACSSPNKQETVELNPSPELDTAEICVANEEEKTVTQS